MLIMLLLYDNSTTINIYNLKSAVKQTSDNYNSTNN